MVITTQPRVKNAWSPIGRTANTQDYYLVRECQSAGVDYWAPKADPDGAVRDRITEAERLQFVEDVRYIIDAVNAEQPRMVLDFGAGLGWLLRELSCEGKLAVETSPLAIAEMERHGITVDEYIGYVPSHSVDVVIAHHVIEHMPDPLYLMHQLRRVLKRGGLLVLATPDFGSPCAVRFGSNYRMLHDPTHCSLFTLESCCRMVRDFGYEIERIAFPFPDRYATAETMNRWNDTSRISPPWPGNWMTLFCRI